MADTLSIILGREDLDHRIDQLETQFLFLAEEAVKHEVGDRWRTWSTNVQKAVVAERALQMIVRMDNVSDLLKGKIIRRIERHTLWAYHPAGYQSLEEMLAVGVGLSGSQGSDLSFIRTQLLPVLERLGYDPEAVYQEAGKAKLRLIVPTARRAIEEGDDQTIHDLIAQATSNTWDGVREYLMGRIDRIPATVRSNNGKIEATLLMDEKQWQLVKIKLRGHIEIQLDK